MQRRDTISMGATMNVLHFRRALLRTRQKAKERREEIMAEKDAQAIIEKFGLRLQTRGKKRRPPRVELRSDC